MFCLIPSSKLPLISIFTKGEGDGIESRLSSKIFSTLHFDHLSINPAKNSKVYFTKYALIYSKTPEFFIMDDLEKDKNT